MEYTVTDQLTVFFFAIVLGLFLGVLNDVFRFLRFLGINSRVAVFIQDIVFMIICAVVSFLFAIAYNRGEVRLFAVFGELLGLLLFRYTVGLVTGKLFRFIAIAIKKVIKLGKAIIKFNIRIIIKLFKPVISWKPIHRKKLAKN